MAQTQVYSPEAVENFATAFPRRNENSFAWGNAISYYLGLPQLRGFWPMSSVNESGNPYDLSGQGRILTNNNAATFGVYGLQSYTELNGANQYHSRADEAGLDITGSLTVGAWIYTTTVAAGVANVIAKRIGAGSLSYYLRRSANQINFEISTDGTNVTTISSVSTISVNTWYFVAGRFTPSTSVSSIVNSEITSNIVAIPATIFNSASPFHVGALTAASERFAGKIALAFVCAASLSDAQMKALCFLTNPLFSGT